jgi:protein-tyrosine-phosphatase/DNA-binding transcriptional ArsR family regulator
MYCRAVPSESVAPPPFVRLASDPLRWRLLCELARSDLRVRELVALVGQPQNLVSYHLGKLRAGGLVTARRSSLDRRDTYYSLDLESCAHALTDTATALHPGLRLEPAPPAGPAPRWRVLFLCTGNSGRSPMAEALLRHRSDGRVTTASAGSQPKALNPHAVRALVPYGITLAHEPVQVDTIRRRRFHLVISLCDRVREVCPEFPSRPSMIHWSIPDPAREGGGALPAYRRTAAELDGRIRFLLSGLGPPGPAPIGPLLRSAR